MFRAGSGRTWKLSGRAMTSKRICELVKRRLKDAGLPLRLSPHSFPGDGDHRPVDAGGSARGCAVPGRARGAANDRALRPAAEKGDAEHRGADFNLGMFAYHDYVKTLAKRFDSRLSEIAGIHGFDYGPEFEITLCTILRSALPEKFGICRGHVVDADGREAGDDIIIYDSQRFPTLRLHPKTDYIRKEWIPIEAVYAYIEAKHTLQIEGDDGSSLRHAVDQVAKVKQLCDTREKVDFFNIRPYFNFTGMGLFNVNVPPGFPDRLNPCFTAVITRQVRQKGSSAILADASQITLLLEGMTFPTDSWPDLIIAGAHNLVLPADWKGADGIARILFAVFYPRIEETVELSDRRTCFRSWIVPSPLRPRLDQSRSNELD